MKVCSICKVLKPRTEFYAQKKKYVSGACKECTSRVRKEKRKACPEKFKPTEEKRERKRIYQQKRREDPEVRAQELEYHRKTRAEPGYKVEEAKRGREFNKDRRNKLQLLKMDRPCYDCGAVHIPEVMEWDHLPGTIKCFDMCRAPHRKLSEVVDEIAKCQLVCANCHRIRTVARLAREAK